MTDTPTPTPPGGGPEPAADPGPDRRPRRWTRILLVISLGFNLVILGLAGGHELSRVLHGPRPPVRELGFGPFTEALSPQDRHAMLRDFLRQAKGFAAQRREMRSDFRSLIRALKAEPYDPATFAAVMARQRARTDHWLTLGQKLLQDRIAAMSPQQRAAFADRLLADFTRHRRHPPPPRDDR
jgi:uncharacterized membrane protein